MRDYAGIHFALLPGSNHPDFSPRVRSMLGTIDYYLRDISRGMGRIENGEVPSGSGTSLSGVTDHGLLTGLADDDHAQYLLLAGRSGGQTAYGGTASGNDLTLASTSNATKGSIFLGTTSVYDETDSLLGIATLSPAARVHAIAKQGSGSTLTPVDTNTNTAWAGPYTGSGGSAGSGSFATNLANNDGDGGYLGILESPVNGTNPQIVGLSGTVTVGQQWLVTLSLRTFSGTLGGGSQVSVRIVDSAGNYFTSSVQSLVGLGSSWTTYVLPVDASGAPGGTATANTVQINGGGGTAYLLMSYVAVDLDVTGTYAEAMTAQAVVGSSGQNIFSVRGSTYADTLFRVLDTGQVNFDDSGTTRAYHRFDGKLYIQHPTTGGSYATQAMIRLVQDDAATNGVYFLSCYDSNLASEVFAIGADGSVTTAAFNLSDVAVGGTSLANFAPLSGLPWAGSFSLYVPDASGSGGGTIVLDSTSGLSFALDGSLTTVLRASTSSSGAAFRDTTTSTRRLRMVLSGAVGNNSFTLTNSAARNYGFGNLSGNVVVVGDDPPSVAPGALGKVDLTGQTAAIGSTNLSSTPPAGFYEAQVVAICTTASGSGTPTLDVTLAWTDALGATTEKTINALALSATGRAHGATRMVVASGNIAYSTTINAASGSPQYAVYIRVVSLG